MRLIILSLFFSLSHPVGASLSEMVCKSGINNTTRYTVEKRVQACVEWAEHEHEELRRRYDAKLDVQERAIDDLRNEVQKIKATLYK